MSRGGVDTRISELVVSFLQRALNVLNRVARKRIWIFGDTQRCMIRQEKYDLRHLNTDSGA
jgi:hypothetical protein